MSEEYLWDKSGEPDPEIQQLEQILGSLRYQPSALELPTETVTEHRKSYLPLLAIAATLVLTVFAGLLWFSLHNRAPKTGVTKVVTPAVPEVSPKVIPNVMPKSDTTSDTTSPSEKKQSTAQATVPRSNKQFVARDIRRVHKPEVVPTEEALHAKEQLMTALRLASEKLNLAQRKAQGPASPNQIRNQHKIG